MPNFLDRVCDQLNLRWAWEKVKKASVPGDIWIDEAALASFELRLGSELERIAVDLRRGRFRVAPLRPMAFPKNPDNEGNARVRQYFNFSVRDQVAWAAVVNVLGPEVDRCMPAWSYGNRLFRSTWIEEDPNGSRRRKVGPYRHTSGRIYRPFQQAWPLFRRHVALAISAAAYRHQNTANLDKEELEELELQQMLPRIDQCPFVRADYWSGSPGQTDERSIYWASVDLEKFYPSVSLATCVDAIVACMPAELQPEVTRVLRMLTQLPLDLEGWTDDELRHIELDRTRKQFHKIPTGLLVSGFLANAALLSVDQEVERSLPRGRVAHFRYVDDHVILATSFEDLLSWIDHYKKILQLLGAGAHINPAKTEPAALGDLLGARIDANQHSSTHQDLIRRAQEACELDPEFPVPLMTKTIALVSAIGRTDFTALEDDELGIISQQLEHLLLVDLPETEIPERTRLAFAATRLARVAEARLASPEAFLHLAVAEKADSVRRGTPSDDVEQAQHDDPVAVLAGISSIEVLRGLANLADRVFALVRRVLREKPDRVRLWTHALTMARRLGSTGLDQLFADINSYARDPINRLAANYVLGNSYAVLGTEVVRAARTLCDVDEAAWRRAASMRFLLDVTTFTQGHEFPVAAPWFVERSFDQLCVGLFCANLLLQRGAADAPPLKWRFNAAFVARGNVLLTHANSPPSLRVAFAWWGCKFELNKPVRRAPRLVMQLGSLIRELRESDDFWAFFPADAPEEALMRAASAPMLEQASREGWWFDALLNRWQQQSIQQAISPSRSALRVAKCLNESESTRQLPLPIWAQRIWSSGGSEAGNEWRLGEWTCLEIIRQAALLLSTDETLDQNYIKRARSQRRVSHGLSAHPLNFTLPAELVDASAVSWQEWKLKLRANGAGVVRRAPYKRRLNDYRYAPITLGPIGPEQNQIRGLGLCLFGLLSRTFLLPTQWNGHGHESLLRHLPQLLRNEITYSSGTLGLLEACLQPRAAENIAAALNQAWIGVFDDDTAHDPIRLFDARQLAAAIGVVQAELEINQISTFNHRSRQLTPVSLMHLTDADWKAYFGETLT